MITKQGHGMQGRALMAALLCALAGCQSLHAGRDAGHKAGHEISGSVLALYATAADAAAVAQGRFGAHPVALSPQGDLSPATDCPVPVVATRRATCMQTKAGQLGWLPT